MSAKASRKNRPPAGAKPIKDRPQALRPAKFNRSVPLSIDKGGQRGVFTQLGFHSVSVAASDGRFSHGGSGDLHLRFNRDQLANMAREFSRDNPLFQGMRDRAAGYIVGTGFVLQAKTGEKDLDAAYEAYWKEYWEEPEVSGLLSGHQVELQVAKEVLSQGDTGIMRTKLGKIQLVESEQIRGKSLQTDGLERDENGVITGYWVAPYSEMGHIQASAARLVRRENFLFPVHTDRPSSKRGVPPMQAAFAVMHRINCVLDAEALAWQQLARLSLIINKKDGGATGLQTSQEDPAKEGSDAPDVTTRVQDWAEGTAFYGEVDEEVRGVDRNIPGANFPASITMFLRLLGLPLGIPLEITSLDWTKSNYSQTRAVLQQAFQTFIGWQQLLERRVYRGLYRWCIEEGIRSGKLTAPADPALTLKHAWIKPTFPWIDQLQETKAWGEMVDRGYATHAQVLKSRDQDRDEIVAELKQETVDAIRISDEIEAETGVRVDWKYFAGRSASVNGGGDPEAEVNGAEAEVDAGAEKEEKKPAKKAPKKAARGTVIQPIVNLTVKPTPAPIRRTTKIKSRGADGKAEDIEQTFEYPPETEVA